MAKLLFIGPGRVGTTLALALQNSHNTILGAIGTSETSPSNVQFQNMVKAPIFYWEACSAVQQVLKKADMILLCVHDNQIGPIAANLATNFPLHQRQIVCHTAGALGLNVLTPILATGAAIGCIHPLQTFVNPIISVAQMAQTYFAVTGDSQSEPSLRQLVADMGAMAFTLRDADRVQYHAGAVLASNALVALMDIAASLMPKEAGFAALLPLIEGTIANLLQVGTKQALTGPIERGDVETVIAHMANLCNHPTARLVYQALGVATVDIASTTGRVNVRTKNRLIQALLGESEPVERRMEHEPNHS